MFAFSPEFLFLNSKFNFSSLWKFLETDCENSEGVRKACDESDKARLIERTGVRKHLSLWRAEHLSDPTHIRWFPCLCYLLAAPCSSASFGCWWPLLFFFFFKLDPLILKALQIPFFLYSHHREGRRNFFLYHFGGRWFIKLRPLSTIWPVTSVLTTQTLQPWRLPSFSSFALILEKQVASSISRTNNLDPAVVFVTWIAQV